MVGEREREGARLEVGWEVALDCEVGPQLGTLLDYKLGRRLGTLLDYKLGPQWVMLLDCEWGLRKGE